MKKHRLIFAIVTVLVLIMIACNMISSTSSNTQEPSNLILLDQTAAIPGGGGSTEVSFKADSRQRIQILLSASNATVQPYASLQSPDGTSTYHPPINTAANGMNQVEIPLNQTGQYTLTLFDGSNQGGTVSVKVVAQK